MIDLEIERQYSGIICGVDEVGRGPLAGPVIACALIASDFDIAGIKDSKLLSKTKREALNEIITGRYKFTIGEASCKEIDELNILGATKLAMTRAVESLSVKIDHVLVDGNMKFPDPRYISIIKGDLKCYSIACASIVAKVYRDNLIAELAKDYPKYGWEQNAGYGTKTHLEAIKAYGLTRHHRRSFCGRFLEMPK